LFSLQSKTQVRVPPAYLKTGGCTHRAWAFHRAVKGRGEHHERCKGGSSKRVGRTLTHRSPSSVGAGTEKEGSPHGRTRAISFQSETILRSMGPIAIYQHPTSFSTLVICNPQASWNGFTVMNHGTRNRQTCRCSHLGRACCMGRLGMAQLDTTPTGTIEFRDEMFPCRIYPSFHFGGIGNWFRDMRAVHKRLSVRGPNASSHLSVGVPIGILGLDRRTIRSHQQNPASLEAPALSTVLLLLWVGQVMGE